MRPESVFASRSRRVLLALLGWLAFATTAEAGIEITGRVLRVTTSDLEITFEGWNVQTIRNVRTGESYIAQHGLGWLDVNVKDELGGEMTAGQWQIGADEVTGARVATITTSGGPRSARLIVGEHPQSAEVFFRLEAQSSRPGLRSMQWGIQGLDPNGGNLLFPGQAGIAFGATTVPQQLFLEYPTHWESQFFLYQRSRGGLLVYARDPKPHFKRVIATREFGTLDVALEVYATAPWSDATSLPAVEWRLKAYDGDWKSGVDYYKEWLSTVQPQRPNSSWREWTKSAKAVIRIATTDMRVLDALAARLIPSETVLYMINWRRDGFDENYPDYSANEAARPFIARARSMGFRVLLHMNALGVATYHRDYELLKGFQLRDPENREPVFWPWGLWPGNDPPPAYLASFAFISPAASTFRRQLVQAVRSAIVELQPHAVHLDAGGVLMNDGNGLIEDLTSIEGMIRLHEDLGKAYPDVVFSYESMTEFLASFHGMAQRWPSDFPAHPIGSYLMGDILWYGFPGQPNPEEPDFVKYIRRFEGQGIMPSLQINDPTMLDGTMTRRILRMMRLWQDYDLRPDWEADWNGYLFRYTSPDRRHTAFTEEVDGRVRLVVDGEVIYERVRGVNRIDANGYVAAWPAFDGTTLYGLDPNREYWLESDISRPAQQVHLSNLPERTILGSRSFGTAEYGYFEFDRAAPGAFDFVAAFSAARRGVIYDLRDGPEGFGAMIQQTRTFINGALKTPVLLMQPPWRLTGAATFIEYDVTLPQGRSQLRFTAQLSDFATNSDGMIFVVRISGNEVFRQEIGRQQTVPAEVDLSRWSGQTVKIRFIVHPGMRLNAASDLAVWSDIALDVQADESPIDFLIHTPSTGGGFSTVGDVTVESPDGSGVAAASSPTPARFVAFARQPRVLSVGQSLLQFQYHVWKAGNGGHRFAFRQETSGQINEAKAAGVPALALATIPPGDGKTYATFPVRIADNVSELRFVVGLTDPTPPLPPTVDYSQATVAIWINGEKVWSKVLAHAGWNVESISLSRWKGQNVLIELEADSQSSPIYDWVHWALLTAR